jgi:hypothetical protein
MTDSQQDAKSAMVVWSALIGRALVEHERTKVDKDNNSKTPMYLYFHINNSYCFHTVKFILHSHKPCIHVI